MRIIENKAHDFKEASLSHAKASYPQPVNEHLPRNYFVLLACGSRQSGKSFAIAQLIKQQELTDVIDPKTKEKVGVRTYLISPTAEQNPVFGVLRSLTKSRTYHDYSEDLLKEILEEVHMLRAETETYQKRMKLWKRFVRTGERGMSMEDLFELDLCGFEEPEKPEYPTGFICNLILDDLVGSNAFKATGKSLLNNLILRNRHHGINLFIANQALKGIPKAIRNNSSVFMMFKFANAKMVCADLQEEVSSHVTEDDFEAVYQHCMEPTEQVPRPFLLVDFTKPRDKVLRKAWDTYLSIEK